MVNSTKRNTMVILVCSILVSWICLVSVFLLQKTDKVNLKLNKKTQGGGFLMTWMFYF